jgi:hypothetical protein
MEAAFRLAWRRDMLAFLQKIAQRLRAFGRPEIRPPEDPETGVRQPVRKRGPGGRSTVAVVEPEE